MWVEASLSEVQRVPVGLVWRVIRMLRRDLEVLSDVIMLVLLMLQWLKGIIYVSLVVEREGVDLRHLRRCSLDSFVLL